MANNKDIRQSSDLKSIGLILKKKREELSYTLEHVSEITRITLTCLRNIEEGNMKALPGLVFVRGFIRNYSKLLGLESDWMIEALNQTYASGTDAPPVREPSYNQDETSSEPKNNVFLYSFGVATVLAIILVVFVVYKRPSNQLSLNSESVETVQAVAPQEEITETVVNAAETGEGGIQTVEAAQVAAPIISPLTLTLVAQEDEWIRLAIDEQDPFELKLKKGEKYEWPAEEEYALILTTGKTATIHLNGEEIVERESFLDQLFEVKLNKFTLKQINNR